MSGADDLDEAIALANGSTRGRGGDGTAPRSGGGQHGGTGPGQGETPRPREGGSRPQETHPQDSRGRRAPEATGGPSNERHAHGGHAHGRDRGNRGKDAHARDLPWPAARKYAARTAGPLPSHNLPLGKALGHTLDTPLDALTDLPSFDTSAMDGWAVSGPGPWELTEDAASNGILAGDNRGPRTLPDGRAVRIATGARVPPGTSAVLRSEYGELRDRRLLPRAGRRPDPGADIRPRGQECRSGNRLLPTGTPVTAAVLGLAAAAGYDELTVTRRPRAEVLVLGDELLHRGVPHDGRIRDALGPMVEPWLAALGAEVLVTRRLGDDAEALHEAVAATTADLLVTTGGTAHGPVDHLRPTLARVDAHLLIEGVRVRPGHPMLLARLPGGRGHSRGHHADRGNRSGGDSQPGNRTGPPDGPYLVGLPGNPLAALSGLVTLAAPLIRALSDHPAEQDRFATLAGEVHGHPEDTRLVPVAYSPAELSAHPLLYNGPAMLRGIATAGALAVIPPGGATPGTEVQVLPLPWSTW